MNLSTTKKKPEMKNVNNKFIFPVQWNISSKQTPL